MSDLGAGRRFLRPPSGVSISRKSHSFNTADRNKIKDIKIDPEVASNISHPGLSTATHASLASGQSEWCSRSMNAKHGFTQQGAVAHSPPKLSKKFDIGSVKVVASNGRPTNSPSHLVKVEDPLKITETRGKQKLVKTKQTTKPVKENSSIRTTTRSNKSGSAESTRMARPSAKADVKTKDTKLKSPAAKTVTKGKSGLIPPRATVTRSMSNSSRSSTATTAGPDRKTTNLGKTKVANKTTNSQTGQKTNSSVLGRLRKKGGTTIPNDAILKQAIPVKSSAESSKMPSRTPSSTTSEKGKGIVSLSKPGTLSYKSKHSTPISTKIHPTASNDVPKHNSGIKSTFQRAFAPKAEKNSLPRSKVQQLKQSPASNRKNLNSNNKNVPSEGSDISVNHLNGETRKRYSGEESVKRYSGEESVKNVPSEGSNIIANHPNGETRKRNSGEESLKRYSGEESVYRRDRIDVKNLKNLLVRPYNNAGAKTDDTQRNPPPVSLNVNDKMPTISAGDDVPCGSKLVDVGVDPAEKTRTPVSNHTKQSIRNVQLSSSAVGRKPQNSPSVSLNENELDFSDSDKILRVSTEDDVPNGSDLQDVDFGMDPAERTPTPVSNHVKQSIGNVHLPSSAVGRKPHNPPPVSLNGNEIDFSDSDKMSSMSAGDGVPNGSDLQDVDFGMDPAEKSPTPVSNHTKQSIRNVKLPSSAAGRKPQKTATVAPFRQQLPGPLSNEIPNEVTTKHDEEDPMSEVIKEKSKTEITKDGNMNSAPAQISVDTTVSMEERRKSAKGIADLRQNLEDTMVSLRNSQLKNRLSDEFERRISAQLDNEVEEIDLPDVPPPLSSSSNYRSTSTISGLHTISHSSRSPKLHAGECLGPGSYTSPRTNKFSSLQRTSSGHSTRSAWTEMPKKKALYQDEVEENSSVSSTDISELVIGVSMDDISISSISNSPFHIPKPASAPSMKSSLVGNKLSNSIESLEKSSNSTTESNRSLSSWKKSKSGSKSDSESKEKKKKAERKISSKGKEKGSCTVGSRLAGVDRSASPTSSPGSRLAVDRSASPTSSPGGLAGVNRSASPTSSSGSLLAGVDRSTSPTSSPGSRLAGVDRSASPTFLPGTQSNASSRLAGVDRSTSPTSSPGSCLAGVDWPTSPTSSPGTQSFASRDVHTYRSLPRSRRLQYSDSGSVQLNSSQHNGQEGGFVRSPALKLLLRSKANKAKKLNLGETSEGALSFSVPTSTPALEPYTPKPEFLINGNMEKSGKNFGKMEYYNSLERKNVCNQSYGLSMSATQSLPRRLARKAGSTTWLQPRSKANAAYSLPVTPDNIYDQYGSYIDNSVSYNNESVSSFSNLTVPDFDNFTDAMDRSFQARHKISDWPLSRLQPSSTVAASSPNVARAADRNYRTISSTHDLQRRGSTLSLGALTSKQCQLNDEVSIATARSFLYSLAQDKTLRQPHMVQQLEKSFSHLTSRLIELTSKADEKDTELRALRNTIVKLKRQSGKSEEWEDASMSTSTTSRKLKKNPSCASLSSMSSQASISSAGSFEEKPKKKKGWLKSSFKSAFGRSKPKANITINEVATSRSDSPQKSINGHEISSLSSFDDENCDPETVHKLKEELRQKEGKLTDIRLEALTSRHQLQHLQDTMNQMKSEMKSLRKENEKLHQLGLSAYSMTSSPTFLHSKLNNTCDAGVKSMTDDMRVKIMVEVSNFTSTNSSRVQYILINVRPLSRSITWSHLDQKLTKLFMAYCQTVDPTTCMKLDKTSIDNYSIGDCVREIGGEAPELLPCGYLVGDTDTVVVKLRDVRQNCVDSLAFELLIDKNIAEKYIDLILRRHRVVICGPVGTGKTLLANRLARYIAEVKDANEPVIYLDAKQKALPELQDFLQNIASRNVESNAVIILDNLQSIISPEKLLEPFSKPVPLKGLYLICVTNHKTSSGLEEFCWITCNNNCPPVQTFLARKLRRAYLEHQISQSHKPEDILSLVITWLPKCWQHINDFLELHSGSEVTIGPRMFSSCPMDASSARVWFTDLWNFSVVPYVISALKRSPTTRKNSTIHWSNPTEWVLETMPWRNDAPDLLHICAEDIGPSPDYSGSIVMSQSSCVTSQSSNASQSSSDPLYNMLMKLQEAANYDSDTNSSHDENFEISIDKTLTDLRS